MGGTETNSPVSALITGWPSATSGVISDTDINMKMLKNTFFIGSGNPSIASFKRVLVKLQLVLELE